MYNINFDIWNWGDPFHIPWKITEGRHSSLPLGDYIKGIARAYNWHKYLGGIGHLKPTAGCNISTLIFGFGGGNLYISHENYRRTANFFATWGFTNGIARAFNWLKYLVGIMHLKPTAGCQISTLIFGLGGIHAYPMANYRRTAKFFVTWGLDQRYCPNL